MVVVHILGQLRHWLATEQNDELFFLTESGHAPIGTSLAIKDDVVMTYLVILVVLTLGQYEHIAIVIQHDEDTVLVESL